MKKGLISAPETARALRRKKAGAASAREVATQAAHEVRHSVASHGVAAYRELLDAVGELVAAEGNALYADTERAVRGRVVFHATEDAHID